jgi:hypothetical protein
LAQLQGRVVEKQRAELVRTLAQSRDVRVTIRCSPAPAVLVYDGGRLLVELARSMHGGTTRTEC